LVRAIATCCDIATLERPYDPPPHTRVWHIDVHAVWELWRAIKDVVALIDRVEIRYDAQAERFLQAALSATEDETLQAVLRTRRRA
jgi:hypothetical protein